MNGTTVFLTAIGYVSFLFLIAWWGDGAGRRFASGRARPVVDHVFPLEEIRAAHERMEAGEQLGKIVLRIPG